MFYKILQKSDLSRRKLSSKRTKKGGREREGAYKEWGRGEGVRKHFNLPGRSSKSMIVYGIPLHQGNTEIRKNSVQKFIFQLVTWYRTVQCSAVQCLQYNAWQQDTARYGMVWYGSLFDDFKPY